MNSLEVQWLGLHTLTAKGLGLIPGQGTRIRCGILCSAAKNNNKKATCIYCDY